MSAWPVTLNTKEQALLTSIMWLEEAYQNQVFCIDVDLDTGRVTLYGEPELTRKFNAELESIMTSIHSALDSWMYVTQGG